MPRISICPCCGYDFRNKNWQKESKLLLEKYDDKHQKIIKMVINVSGKYTRIFPKDVYLFLMGISTVEKSAAIEGCKVFLRKKSYHTKGLNYAKYIILNLDKNEELIRERLIKSIGGRQTELQ